MATLMLLKHVEQKSQLKAFSLLKLKGKTTPYNQYPLFLYLDKKFDHFVLYEIYDIYYAIQYNLYSWVIGCASLYQVNEKLWNHLSERKLCHLLKKDKVKTMTINSIIEIYNINSIEYLKIDTEGQDYNIMLSILNGNRSIKVDKIQFESYLKSEKLNIIKNILINNNYIELYSGHDTFMINKNSLTRLLCNPNVLDQIFIQDLKYNLDIRDF